jgi:hypothetical protein
MANVTGEQYFDLDGQLSEIKRQLRQQNGYPYNLEKLKRHLQDAIKGKFKQVESFKTWKTIKIGTGLKTPDDFRKELTENGFRIEGLANSIIDQPGFTTSDEGNEVELVKLTIRELGFKNGASIEQIYAMAIELGLDLCPSEVGPQLRLQYKKQPNPESIRIAMEPIVDFRGNLYVFGVRENGLLSTFSADPKERWDSCVIWVFARRK